MLFSQKLCSVSRLAPIPNSAVCCAGSFTGTKLQALMMRQRRNIFRLAAEQIQLRRAQEKEALAAAGSSFQLGDTHSQEVGLWARAVCAGCTVVVITCNVRCVGWLLCVGDEGMH